MYNCSLQAPETNWRIPRCHRKARHQSWRELATTRGYPDNPNPPTVDHNCNLHTRDTVTHKDINITRPIATIMYIAFCLVHYHIPKNVIQ